MSIKPFINKKSFSAFTVLEVMIALGISSIIITVIASATIYSSRSMAALLNYSELNRKSMAALDVLTRDIRQMTAVTSISSNFVALKDVTDSATNYLSFRWDEGTRELTRDYNGKIEVLLEDCDSLNFQGHKRVPKASMYTNFYPETVKTDQIKMIQVDWVCYRDVMAGDKRTTESVQTAKIVIRAQ